MVFFVRNFFPVFALNYESRSLSKHFPFLNCLFSTNHGIIFFCCKSFHSWLHLYFLLIISSVYIIPGNWEYESTYIIIIIHPCFGVGTVSYSVGVRYESYPHAIKLTFRFTWSYYAFEEKTIVYIIISIYFINSDIDFRRRFFRKKGVLQGFSDFYLLRSEADHLGSMNNNDNLASIKNFLCLMKQHTYIFLNFNVK